jgi:hypothetical protein
MADKWFIEREGEVYGPADATELSQWIDEGRLDPNDLLWPENADRTRAVRAETALQTMGLTLASSANGDAEVPVLESASSESYELPILDLGAVDEQMAKQSGKAGKPLPDWVRGLADAVEASRQQPRPVRPDWLEDVRQAEQAARPPARRDPGTPRP